MALLRIATIGVGEICFLGMQQVLNDTWCTFGTVRLEAARVGESDVPTADVFIIGACRRTEIVAPLIRKIETAAPGSPILVCASAREDDLLAFQAGATGCITTCSIGDLRAALTALCAGRIYFETLAHRQTPDSLLTSPPEDRSHVKPTGPLGPAEPSILSPRQRQILELAGRCLSDKEIAKLLGISAHTVRSHLRLVFEKCGVRKRSELVLRQPLINHGLAVSLPC